MRSFIHRLVSLPGAILGLTASLTFASTQLWAQSSPGVSRSRAGESTAAVAAATPTIDGKLRNMVITGARGDSLEITYANTGTVPTAIMGEVQVFVSENEIVATVPFADTQIVKAGTTQRFRVAMPKLAKGRYTLIAVVEYGGDTMTAAHAKLDMR